MTKARFYVIAGNRVIDWIAFWQNTKCCKLIVKSSYCKQCEYWKDKYNSAEFKLWMQSHKETCSNYEKNSDKMEVDEVIEMFKRVEDLHKVKYLLMTVIVKYKGIVELQPWKHNDN